MHRLRPGPIPAAAIAALILAGCTESTNLRTITVGLPTKSEALLVPGSMSMVTTREVGERGLAPIVCIAPSPDWAVASGSVTKLEGSGGAAEAKGSLSAERDRSEAITAMSGRSAAVVALRDGLFAACQAYANGVIGKDAYALVISQYSDVLVAIATGSDPLATPAGKSAPRAAIPTDGVDRRAAAALLVACIEEHDPTRDASVGRGPVNPLLEEGFCRRVLTGVQAAGRRR